MTNLIQRWRQVGGIHLIWPLLACIVGWRFILYHFNDPVQWDSQHNYLPAARAFLQQGWDFLLKPESYRVAPLGYLWPALWGADPTWIRAANMGLWVGCVWFLWRTSSLLGGWRAGMAAMLLLLFSDLLRYFPSEMTEPVYLFGVFGLIHAMARLIVGRDDSWNAVAQGAAMLTVTLLSRPILQLIAPAALLVCMVALVLRTVAHAKRAHTDGNTTLSRATFGLGLGLVLPLAWVVKNGLTFGLWGIGTGAGTGFYLGTHPLFQGTEPDFLGFGYDINALIAIVAPTSGGYTLSLAGDRVARAAGLWHIQTMSVTDIVMFFSRKLWWWLAQHPTELQRNGNGLRQLRLFELLTIIVTALWVWRGWRCLRCSTTLPRGYAVTLVREAVPRQWAFAALLLGVFALLVGQLLPILYNSRYSVALLDPWLIPLSAFCVARIVAPVRLRWYFRKNRWSVGMAAPQGVAIGAGVVSFIVIAALTSATYNLARRWEHVGVDVRHMGQVATDLRITDSARIAITGMAPQGKQEWVITESPAALMVGLDQPDVQRIHEINPFNALWNTELRLRSTGSKRKTCKYAEIAYQTAAGAILQPAYRLPLLLPLNVDGQFHRLVTHANGELRPREAGSLRIVLHCPVGTVVEWKQTQFLESRHIWNVATHIKQ